MPFTPSFLNSSTLQNYNPQFLDTTAAASSAGTAATDSQPDLTNRLLQIMSGQIGGTLSGGEKLSALGALLKSVSRGSQTTPQQVLQGIQQQKLAEVQGQLQLKALLKQAKRDALTEAWRSKLQESATSDQERAFIGQASGEDIAKYYIEKVKAEEKTPPAAQQLANSYIAKLRESGRQVSAQDEAKIIYDFARAQNPQNVGNVLLNTQYPGLATPMQSQPVSTRPAGLSDDQILAEANKAIANGKDPSLVKQQLIAWGVKV